MTSGAIKKIIGREILDSRDDPTVEAEVVLEDGSTGRASVPSGKSRGKNEAVELRDDDPNRFGGKGVLKAVNNVNTTIAEAVFGIDAENQMEIDRKMIGLDGTENKSVLGANAMLAVSLASAKAAAASKKIPLFKHIQSLSTIEREVRLPEPFCNILNGGSHTNWQSTDIQEFMVVPHLESFKKDMQMLTEVFDSLKSILEEKNYSTNVGDEGGFAPKLESNMEALELVSNAIQKAGYKIGSDASLALDIASSSFYDESIEKYKFKIEQKEFNRSELIDFYKNLSQKFGIMSIEDGFSEDDWPGWTEFTREMGDKIQIVGDDLLVTNIKFLKRAVEEKAGNAILIKPNQIGTLSETIEAADLAHKNGWNTVISHRSGETEDTSIAHIAVGLGSKYIKAGSVSRSERVAKYNELLRIEEEFGLKTRN